MGLVRIVSPFGHAGVNAYIIIMGQHALAFDTGTDCGPLIEYLEQHQLVLDAFISPTGIMITSARIKSFDKTRIIYPEDTQHGQQKNPTLETTHSHRCKWPHQSSESLLL